MTNNGPPKCPLLTPHPSAVHYKSKVHCWIGVHTHTHSLSLSLSLSLSCSLSLSPSIMITTTELKPLQTLTLNIKLVVHVCVCVCGQRSFGQLLTFWVRQFVRYVFGCIYVCVQLSCCFCVGLCACVCVCVCIWTISSFIERSIIFVCAIIFVWGC